MTDLSGIKLPFGISDLVGSGSGLLGLVGPFILLGLAFVFVPMIIYLVRTAIETRQDNRMNADKTRDQYSFGSRVKQDIWEDKLYGVRKRLRR